MLEVVTKDQFAEITVFGDEDTLFLLGNGKDFFIGEGFRIINSHDGNIVS